MSFIGLNCELEHGDYLTSYRENRSAKDEISLMIRKTQEKRIKAAELVTSIVHKINEETTNAKIIVMGDFNDNNTTIHKNRPITITNRLCWNYWFWWNY